MEDQDRKMNGHDHQEEEASGHNEKKKGGFITMPFIIANESLEKVASYGLMPNMILYLMKDYKMSVATGTNLLFFWSATTNFLPVIGAFIADSFLGRFFTIGFGSIFSLLGMILLWLTTVIPQAKPPPCNPKAHDCKSPNGGQFAFLVFSFLLMSIGAGGVRPCSQAFGADQFDKREDPVENKKMLETFFGWYYASASLSVVVALTVIVYIQDHLGWRVGFGIPAILMFLSVVSFFLASPFYVKNKVKKSLFSSFVQVIVVTFRKRRVALPSPGSNVMYCQKKDSKQTVPTERLRFLNKACIVVDPDQDIKPDGLPNDPWRLTTVEEVEELKCLIRVLPIWSTGIIMSMHTGQGSFPLLQAKTMDRHLGNFEIPAGSFGMFTIIAIVIWIPIYDRVLIPLASKIRGKPVRINLKVRMGVGLIFAFLSMMVAGLIESIRRQRAINAGLANDSQSILHMSAMWLVPQHALSGLAEAFNAIGQNEFYYSEFPKSMSSIGMCLFGLGMAVANLLSSVLLSSVDDITKRGGKDGWITNNINKGHYEYYYWLLATLSFFNIIYYIFCSWLYGPLVDKRNKVSDENNKKESTFQVEEELAMLRNNSRQEKEEFTEDLGLSKSNEMRV